MNLEIFTLFLRDLDDACGSSDTNMWNCGVKQNDENTFEFSYDALCTCQIRFNADGTISEWVETLYEEITPESPYRTFRDLIDFRVEMVKIGTFES